MLRPTATVRHVPIQSMCVRKAAHAAATALQLHARATAPQPVQATTARLFVRITTAQLFVKATTARPHVQVTTTRLFVKAITARPHVLTAMSDKTITSDKTATFEIALLHREIPAVARLEAAAVTTAVHAVAAAWEALAVVAAA